jgi:uncharacterized SAM-binding protein YcdF (DUF218 family)
MTRASVPNSHRSTVESPALFFGLVSRRERWGLSLRGFIVIGLCVAIAFTGVTIESYSFLAITSRVPTDTLVVEGWIHEYAIRQAVAEYASGQYKHLFTTGGPVVGQGGYTNDYNTSASVGAELLRKTGIPRELVQMVPSRVNDRDRTYGSAVALRNWLTEHQIRLASFNVLTENTHARRTRLLFEKALGPTTRVGIIAVHSPDYNANYWWQYSDGVREVIGESLAYVYAKFLFKPTNK